MTCAVHDLQALKETRSGAARPSPAARPLRPAPCSHCRTRSRWLFRRIAQLLRKAACCSWSHRTHRAHTQPRCHVPPSAWMSSTMRRMQGRLQGTQRSRARGRRSAQPTAWRSLMIMPAWVRVRAARRTRWPASFQPPQSPGPPRIEFRYITLILVLTVSISMCTRCPACTSGQERGACPCWTGSEAARQLLCSLLGYLLLSSEQLPSCLANDH